MDTYLFLTSILVLIVSSIFYNLLKNKPSRNGLRSYPILGNLPDFIKNKNRFLQWTTEILSATTPTHTVILRVPSQPDQILTSNPLNVEYVLNTNCRNYPKGDLFHFILKDLLGDGIFNSDGEQWHSQRKIACFELNKRSLRSFVMKIVEFEILQRLIPVVNAAVEKRTILNLQDVLQRFAFDNICKVAFDFDPETLSEDGISQCIPSNFMTAFDDSANLIMNRLLEPAVFIWRVKRFLNIGKERQLKESMKVVNDFAYDIIRNRKSNQHASSSHSNDDLLSRFAEKEDRTEQFLRDVILNFVTAGRETTSSALTWFFWLLSSNPDVEFKILEEIKFIKTQKQNHTYGNSGILFDFDQLREMNYLHAAISESLRLTHLFISTHKQL
ncbi:hypothetical protein ZOSMA_2G02560 [Zostera marina]|uniref:Cytochrome P450 n=1 Tax=Zostera marina TaxID=29655 RepID=A0A0K9PBB7_ZOSMR|nr:hypothetical protein ZOSMA_2G02560 [Zostera marina]